MLSTGSSLTSFMLLIVAYTILAYYPYLVTSTGEWQVLQDNVGISAMHMQLLYTDRVVIFDRTDFGRSNISLPNNKCRNNSNELVVKNDCTAHSIEYNVLNNTFRPLMILTDTWCSSGAIAPDGRLVQTGGFNDGDRSVRIYNPCESEKPSCDWKELGQILIRRRWYASNHLLPNGQFIIVGGIDQFNYEFYPKTETTMDLQNLQFLEDTTDPDLVYNNLYPYVYLNVDGNLFIFANNRAILLDYTNNIVVKTYPTMPDEQPRNYPSTGSAVLLPLKIDLITREVEAEFLVCGGAPKGSYKKSLKSKFIKALDTCARIKITDPEPQWVTETMPMARVMGDMVLLPNGRVLIVNGCGSGTAGWNQARDPVLSPVLYNPDEAEGSRFEVGNPTEIPRVYHSTAILLRDGRVMVGGGNTNAGYEFQNVLFPTLLSLEAYSPPYLVVPDSASLRPRILSPTSVRIPVKHGQVIGIRFNVTGSVDRSRVKVTMIMPPFNTHSFSQGQRMLVLSQAGPVEQIGGGTSTYHLQVKAPPSGNLAPSGYYMLFVVHQDVPSEGIWVRIR